jgi:hypothetical protein
MNNKKPHRVSPSFIFMLIIFIGLLSYFCYSIIYQTGLIPSITSKVDEVAIDTNQVKLAQRDSIINLRDIEIFKLKEELLKKVDTIYIKPTLNTKKRDNDSFSGVSLIDSVK